MLYQTIQRLKKVALCAALLSSIMTSPAAMADFDAECAIWLCLPTAFGTGCSEAKDAFKDRIKHFKPPLPSFTACLFFNDGSEEDYNIGSKEGVGAFIPEHEVCAKTTVKGGGRDKETICIEYKTIDSEIIKDTTCFIPNSKSNNQERTPAYCSHTMRYVQTFMEGVPMGEPYYY